MQAALRILCHGKEFDEQPPALRKVGMGSLLNTGYFQYITAVFNTIDADGDGFIGPEEFRYDCVNRQPVGSIEEGDRAFERISQGGGITRAQYETMFAKYLGSQDPKAKACYMFGPLPIVK